MDFIQEHLQKWINSQPALKASVTKEIKVTLRDTSTEKTVIIRTTDTTICPAAQTIINTERTSHGHPAKPQQRTAKGAVTLRILILCCHRIITRRSTVTSTSQPITHHRITPTTLIIRNLRGRSGVAWTSRNRG